MPEPVPPAEVQSSPSKRPSKVQILGKRGYSPEQWMIGIGGTIFAHIWILFLFFLMGLFDRLPRDEPDPYRDFSIELADSEEAQEPDLSYTETNPDVPENEPDDTNRFGARDQQAANEEAPMDLDPDRRPATESEELIETDQVLTGSLEEPFLAPPPRESAEEENQEQPQEPSPQRPLLQAVTPSEAAQRKEIPLFGSLEEESEDESGIADYDYDQLDEAPTNVTDLIEGEQEEGEAEMSVSDSPEAVAAITSSPSQAAEAADDGIPSPRARPQLPRLPSAPVRNSRLGVSEVGQLSVDAKASKFGEYMERLIETVKINWDDLVHRSSHIERNTVVKIRFILTKDGLISDMEILEGTTSKAAGIYMCRHAIERGIPFGEWPSGLIELFGDEEDITFTFHYN